MYDADADEDYYYAHDHLYSPTALLDDSAAVVERIEYNAYGQADVTIVSGSGTGNEYLFTGRRLDILDTNGSLKIYYYRNRCYDPHTGRFLTHDPLGITPNSQRPNEWDIAKQYSEGMSLYGYVKAMPTNSVDPYGFACGCVVKRATAYGLVSGSSVVNFGHEWITCDGDSIGFWPNRNWTVQSPDPAEDRVMDYIIWETDIDKGWFREKKLKWGQAAGSKCACASCADIRACVMASPNPGWRSCGIISNCRRYSKRTLPDVA